MGQLGIGNTQNVGDEPGEMPPATTDIGPVVPDRMCLAQRESCVLTVDGKVKCWGIVVGIFLLFYDRTRTGTIWYSRKANEQRWG